jgi:hypothetical protein
MTDQVRRLYALALSLLGFFLAWAGIAAHPWAAASSGEGLRGAGLASYEQRLQADAALVDQLRARRTALPARSVRIVTLPPLTMTRSS